MHAVKQNGDALKYVKKKNQTLEICVEAINQNISAVYYVKPEMLNLVMKSYNEKIKRNIVFEDIVATTFNYVENADNIMDAITKYIEIKHGIDFAKQILDTNVNPSLIDDKYVGLYIKKLNDSIYELHDRQLQKKNNGWIINNYVDVIMDTLVGKFIVPI